MIVPQRGVKGGGAIKIRFQKQWRECKSRMVFRFFLLFPLDSAGRFVGEVVENMADGRFGGQGFRQFV